MRSILKYSIYPLAILLLAFVIYIAFLWGYQFGLLKGISKVYASQTWVIVMADESQKMINQGYQDDFYKRINGGNSIRPSNKPDIFDLYYENNRQVLGLRVTNGIVTIIDPGGVPNQSLHGSGPQ